LDKLKICLALLGIIGVLLLIVSFNTAMFVGDPWLSDRAHDDWHMNNYTVIPGFLAYIFFAFIPLALGGVFFGVFLPLVSLHPSKKRVRLLLLSVSLAVLFTSLGFNTFDMMLGCFYWTNGTEPAPILVNLFFAEIHVNAWNFYFFLFIIPLWVSGFLMGLSACASQFKLKNRFFF